MAKLKPHKKLSLLKKSQTMISKKRQSLFMNLKNLKKLKNRKKMMSRLTAVKAMQVQAMMKTSLTKLLFEIVKTLKVCKCIPEINR